MSIKKCVNGSFVNDFYKEYGTDTDTITSLPKTIIGDGQPISAYTIKGNMSQSGTPTPSNPVYPTEVGEKTANLLDKSKAEANCYYNNSDVRYQSNYHDESDYIPVTQGQTYTLYTDKLTTSNFAVYVNAYDTSKTFSSNVLSLTAPSGYYSFVSPVTGYIRFNYLDRIGYTKDTMFYEGSSQLPYEPYGYYKIPISFGQGTYTNYLSEPIRKIGTAVDSMASTGTATRNIYKFVLTGQETWTYQSSYSRFITSRTDVNFTGNRSVTMICSHYGVIDDGRAIENVPNNSLYATGYVDEPTNLCIKTDAYTTEQSFKDYLAAQYSSGTPVTIWYILKTATTESFTAPTIPTSGTAEQFDVSTTLKPSEVSLTWHGWHEHSDEKYVGGLI